MRTVLALLALTIASCGDAPRPALDPPPRGGTAEPRPPRARAAVAEKALEPPLLQGRTPAGWVEQFLCEDGTERFAAREALASSPELAVPALIARLLETQGRAYPGPVNDLLAELHDATLPFVLGRIDAADTDEAAILLGVLGELAARGLLGAGADSVRDAVARRLPDHAAIRVLADRPEWALSVSAALVDVVRSTADGRAEAAAEAIARLGPRASSCVPCLLAIAQDTKTADNRSRGAALTALGCVAPSSPEVLAAVVACLSDESEPVRCAAVLALGGIGLDGPAGRTAESVLLALARDEEESRTLRCAAVRTLGRTGDATELVKALGALASSAETDVDVRGAAALELAERAQHDEAAFEAFACACLSSDGSSFAYSSLDARAGLVERLLPRFRATLEDPTACGRESAWEFVRRLDVGFLERESRRFADDPCDAIRASATWWADTDDGAWLASRLRDPSAAVRASAAANLGFATDPSPGTIADLVAALGDETCRAEAVRSLGRLGRAAEVALPRLRELTAASDSALAAAASLAVLEIESDSGMPVAQLVARLGDPDADVRGAACDALGALGPDAASATEALVRSLDDEAVRSRAAYALGHLGSAGVEALLCASEGAGEWSAESLGHGLGVADASHLPAILSHASDEAVGTRIAVSYALGWFDEEVARAALARFLADGAAQVRRAAAESSDALEAAGPSLVAALRLASEDADAAVALAAAKALRKFTHDDEPYAVALCRALAASPGGSDVDTNALVRLSGQAARGVAFAGSALSATDSYEAAQAALAVLRSAGEAARSSAPKIAAFLARTRGGEPVTDARWVAVRAEAARLLGSFADAEGTPGLRELSHDPCREVRDAANAALVRIGSR